MRQSAAELLLVLLVSRFAELRTWSQLVASSSQQLQIVFPCTEQNPNLIVSGQMRLRKQFCRSVLQKSETLNICMPINFYSFLVAILVPFRIQQYFLLFQMEVDITIFSLPEKLGSDLLIRQPGAEARLCIFSGHNAQRSGFIYLALSFSYYTKVW